MAQILLSSSPLLSSVKCHFALFLSIYSSLLAISISSSLPNPWPSNAIFLLPLTSIPFPLASHSYSSSLKPFSPNQHNLEIPLSHFVIFYSIYGHFLCAVSSPNNSLLVLFNPYPLVLYFSCQKVLPFFHFPVHLMFTPPLN